MVLKLVNLSEEQKLDNVFEAMADDFKTYSELQKFSDAQMSLIAELQKKILFLEEKNLSLETIINSTTPMEITLLPISNQELICREQLEILKQNSSKKELSFEECKKVSEYSKILKDLQESKKSLPSTAKRIQTTDLLTQLESNEHQT